jgi:hypothetical protein
VSSSLTRTYRRSRPCARPVSMTALQSERERPRSAPGSRDGQPVTAQRRSTKQLASSSPASAGTAELHHHAEIVSAGDVLDGSAFVVETMDVNLFHGEASTGRWHHLKSVTVLQHECAGVPTAHHRARHHGVAFRDGLLLDELELGVCTAQPRNGRREAAGPTPLAAGASASASRLRHCGAMNSPRSETSPVSTAQYARRACCFSQFRSMAGNTWYELHRFAGT